jgi:glycosyltransferase involved in cell wall biosynthesis
MSNKLVNVAYFSNQFASASGHGIAHYARRVYEGIRANHADIRLIPVATGCDRSPEEYCLLQDETGLVVLPWGRKLTPLAWAFWGVPPIEHWIDAPVDITHIVSLGFPVVTRKKLVVTVHDIGPLTHPEYFYKYPWKFRRSFEQMVRHADKIVCVSQATADEVVGYAGAALSDRIEVVHEGVDVARYADVSAEVCREKVSSLIPANVPFFMAAGAVSPRKNIAASLKAFALVKDAVPHHFVLVGGSGWNEGDIDGVINQYGLGDRVHRVGYVSDEELFCLYKSADFYLHVSLFEGFGLTVLEAMAAGCPVITSNISSLPEVAGDAALLIDPHSVDAIAEAIESFALNESVRNGFAIKGRGRIEDFKWENTADQIAGIYRDVV